MVIQTDVATITGSNATISYIVANTSLDYFGVLSLVEDIMRKTLEYTIPQIKAWIKEYVAKRTGQLQDDLIKTLENSQWVNQQLRLELGTMLPYAGKINSDRSLKIQHSNELGYAYSYGVRGKVILKDSKAQYGFWGLLKMESRKRLRENFTRSRFEICGKLGVSGQSIQRKLRVKI